MRAGLLTGLSAVAVITAGMLASAALAFGQEPAAIAAKAGTGKTWTPPRTPDGQPDLQGRYTRNGVGAGGTGQSGALIIRSCPNLADGSFALSLDAGGNSPKRPVVTAPLQLAVALGLERFQSHPTGS